MRFGIKIPFVDDLEIYDSLTRRLSFGRDLEWHERYHLQRVLAKASIWDGFPFEDCQLIASEVYLCKYRQRIDFLYLHRTGLLRVCELKLGGEEKDIVGQLLRYIEELAETDIDIDWVKRKAADFRQVSRIDSIEFSLDRHCRKLYEFITSNNISNVVVDRRTAVFIGEEPDERALLGARILNDGGYDGQAYSAEMLASDDWSSQDPVQYMKFNIEEIDLIHVTEPLQSN